MAVRSPLEGRYDMSIDAKGRLFFPAKQREKLEGMNLHITRGMDGCLFIYTDAQWEALRKKFEEFPVSRSRVGMRALMGNSLETSLDPQGRITVSSTLRLFAGLTKEVTLVGLLDRMELWDTARWDAINDEVSSDDLAAILEEMNF